LCHRPLSLLSLLCLHRLLPDNTPNARARSLSLTDVYLITRLGVHNKTRRCYATAYNNRDSSARRLSQLSRDACLQAPLPIDSPPDIVSSRTHRGYRFPQFLCCCADNCCYVDVAFRVPLLCHCLAMATLPFSVSQYKRIVSALSIMCCLKSADAAFVVYPAAFLCFVSAVPGKWIDLPLD
jgi:hypothetical protein